ncbi:MAG: radical SAM protein [Candidatus Lokiarchaeota archaeon]|nr:radical SAM protein [Candidatus Lokiarchaeota archaeon]
MKNGIKIARNQIEDTVRKWSNIPKIRCIRYTTTWECNSKCDSCSIWKIDPKKNDIMTLKELERFASSDLLKDVRRIVISGGEPFLLEDLPERLQILHKSCPNAYFGMTANGLTPERTLRLVKRIFKLSPDINIGSLGLSLNGPPEIHDRSRGIEKAFEKTIETYELIKDYAPVRFSFTFLPYNINEYSWVKEFAKQKGTEVYICWTVISNRFFDRNFLGDITIKEFYQKLRPVLNEENFKIRQRYLYNSFIEERHLDCTAFRDFFHIDPYGNIYPCNFKLTEDRIIGNVKETNFAEIWSRKKVVEDIKSGGCLYPNGVCGDSDIFYSVSRTGMHRVLFWSLISDRKI